MGTKGNSEDTWKPSAAFEENLKNEISAVFEKAGVNVEESDIRILRRVTSYMIYITLSQNVSVKKELKSSTVAAFKEEGAAVDEDDVDIFKGGRSIHVKLKPTTVSSAGLATKSEQVSYMGFLAQFTFRSIELIDEPKEPQDDLKYFVEDEDSDVEPNGNYMVSSLLYFTSLVLY